MDDKDREKLAKRWLATYGVAIDSHEIAEIAARRVLEARRERDAKVSMLTNAADLLASFREQLRGFNDHKVHGTRKPLSEFRSTSADLLLLFGLERTEDRVPRAWHSFQGVGIELLQVENNLRAAAREEAHEARRRGRDLADLGRQLGDPVGWARAQRTRKHARRGPVLDLAFCRACYELGEFTARHHPRRTAQWDDVAQCLEWYDHPPLSRHFEEGASARAAATRYRRALQRPSLSRVRVSARNR